MNNEPPEFKQDSSKASLVTQPDMKGKPHIDEHPTTKIQERKGEMARRGTEARASCEP